MGCNCGKSRAGLARRTAGGMSSGPRMNTAPLRQLTPQQTTAIEQQRQLAANPPQALNNSPDRRMMERRRRDILANRLRRQ